MVTNLIKILIQHFYEVGSHLCYGHADDAFEHDHDAAAAVSADLYEGSSYSVEGASEYAYRRSFLQVDLVRAEVYQPLVAVFGDFDELLHFTVRYYDGDILTVAWARKPLKEWDISLYILYVLPSGMHEDQVMYGGNQFFGLVSVAFGYRHVPHGNETLKPCGLQQVSGLDFPAESRAHGKPLNRGK